MLSRHCPNVPPHSDEFGSVTACELNIRIIDRISESMCFITVLHLSRNHLLSLSGVEQFHNLEHFNFDFNHISLPTEFSKVRNPFFMKTISFIANPIEYTSNIDAHWLRSKGYTRLMHCNQQFDYHFTLAEQELFLYERPTMQDTPVQPKAQMPSAPKTSSVVREKKQISSAQKTKRIAGKITVRDQLTNKKYEQGNTNQYLITKNTDQTQERNIEKSKPQYVHPFLVQTQSPESALAYIESQRRNLAQCFHLRVCLQKAFKGWKKNAIEREDGLLHRLQLQRWAWMKLKLKCVQNNH